MPDTETTTEQTPSLESQMMASLDKADSGQTSEVEAVPETTEETTTEEAVAETETETEVTQESEAEVVTDETDPEFKEAADKHGIPSADDLPPELKPLWDKKAKEMQAGFTRAMQEAREYRKEKAEYDSEKSYRTTAPDQWLADMIQQNPELIEKVNAELEKRADPTYAEAHKMRRDAERTRSEAEVVTRAEQERVRQERIEHVENYMVASSKKAGIPAALVEDAIAAAILAKPENERDISDAEIDSIIEAKAKVYRVHVGAHKGAQTREYTKNKANDAKGVTIPPKTNTASETVQVPKPKNLEEAMNQALDKLGMVA